MKSKFLEIRDAATRIPVLAMKMQGETPIETAYFEICGWDDMGEDNVILLKISGIPELIFDPSYFKDIDRTIFNAHTYIQKNFDKLNNGDVVDVQFILGETKIIKTAEIIK